MNSEEFPKNYSNQNFDEILPLFQNRAKDLNMLKSQKTKKNRSLVYLDPPSGFIIPITPIHIRVCGDAIGEFFDLLFSEFSYVEEITFECVFISNLILKENLTKLQKLKRLITLNLTHNNLLSYLDLLALENLPHMTRLSVINNPICVCSLLKYFVFYRFSRVRYFNSVLKKDKDVQTTKDIYLKFDKLLKKSGKIDGKQTSEQTVERKVKAKHWGQLFVGFLMNQSLNLGNFEEALSLIVYAELAKQLENDKNSIETNL